MKNRTILSLCIALYFSISMSLAQIPGVTFSQGDNVPVAKGKKGYHQLNLKGEPFTIFFEGNELMVCAGLEEEMFQFTKSGTDINADFKSYFFIYKFIAMPGDATYLSLEKDEGTSLNDTHGAKPASDGVYQYTVNTLRKDGKDEPLSSYKKFYLAVWLDANKDQFIDKEELMQILVNVD